MLSGFSVNGIFQIQGKLTVMSLSVLLRETHCLVQKVGLNSCMQRKHIGEEAEMKSLCMFMWLVCERLGRRSPKIDLNAHQGRARHWAETCNVCDEWVMLCSCPAVMALSYFAACETTVELLFDSVIHLGCKPYLDSQRAACRCRYEEKTDLWRRCWQVVTTDEDRRT